MRFDMICEANDIEHRLTKPNHPWTNGQVERMNRTIKEAPVKRFHYESHEQFQEHLSDFMAAYNFARRLKTFSGLAPTNTLPRSGRQSRTGSSSLRSTRCRDPIARISLHAPRSSSSIDCRPAAVALASVLVCTLRYRTTLAALTPNRTLAC